MAIVAAYRSEKPNPALRHPPASSICSGPCERGSTIVYHVKQLQYPVKVEKPDPVFARMLQQAIGGVEGEIRVRMQYMLQFWSSRGPSTKYRDMLVHTATEEIGHIEMLATAVAMNLENASTEAQEAGAKDEAMVGAQPLCLQAAVGVSHAHLRQVVGCAVPG